jgi:homoserine trans-succinylase
MVKVPRTLPAVQLIQAAAAITSYTMPRTTAEGLWRAQDVIRPADIFLICMMSILWQEKRQIASFIRHLNIPLSPDHLQLIDY